MNLGYLHVVHSVQRSFYQFLGRLTDRGVPERLSLDDASLGQYVLRQCVPWTICPWTMCPLDNMSLDNVSLGRSDPARGVCISSLYFIQAAGNHNNYSPKT